MADIAALTALIEPEAKALGFNLVRVKMYGGDDPTLQVMAERPATRQLNIDDCAALSRGISTVFDALEEQGRDPIDHAYRLEVSSPGIDRPLTRLSDFAEWRGHEARVTLAEQIDGRKQFNRVGLDGVDGDEVLLTDLKAPRDAPAIRIPFSAIVSAKLLLTDALIAATMPLSTAGADEIETQIDAPEEGQD